MKRRPASTMLEKSEGPAAAASSAVEVVHVDTRRLIVWDVGFKIYGPVDGAIVWVKPDAQSTPESVAELVAYLRKSGAARVVVMPFEARAAAVPASVHDEPAAPHASIREVVEELLAEVTEEPELVREVVEQAMAEAGL